jgi:predicted nucleotidyltransferase
MRSRRRASGAQPAIEEPIVATNTLVPPELLDPVVAYFNPQKVILIGSVARGGAGPDSDIDLVVVLDDDIPLEMLNGKAVAEARANYRRAVDIIPCRASKLRERGRATGSFAHQILRDGITVYERP